MSSSRSSSAQALFNRRAELCLRFVIVGAGLAGLAVAYNLRKAGHSVCVLEKADGVGKAIGGVRVPPNMSQLLMRWGLGPKLKKFGGVCRGITFHDGVTGEEIGDLLYHAEIMKELAGDVFMMRHSDLHEALYEIAVNAGVRVEFNAKVVAVDPETPSVTLESGKKVYGDLVIGTDGDESLVRKLMFDEDEEDEMVQGPWTGYVFSVPITKMQNDEELKELVRDPGYSWRIWLNDHCAILTHPARNNTELCVNLYWNERKFPPVSGWSRRIPLNEVDFSMFEPRLQRLGRLASYAIQCKHTKLNHLEQWYHESDRVLVAGEAAHLLNPGNSHNAAMGIEDAATLGSLFSRLRTRDQIATLLEAYQELRKARFEYVAQSEKEKLEFITMPPGPQRDSRDQYMRAARASGQLDWENSPEQYLREQWEQFKELFGFNAYDDADTWWVEWGVLHDRVKGRHEDMSLGMTVEIRADVAVDSE